MSLDTPVESLASAFYDARARTGENTHCMEAYHFPQGWGSTALGFGGFGGIGGQSMPTAYTTVIMCPRPALVYFNGRYAYTVERPNRAFRLDLAAHRMEAVSDYRKYERA